ncbi:MAG: site-specific integrase [Casimicrobiaceae bacterium]
MSADCREFAFYTGVRCPSELIELQWRDVDFEAHTLTVSRANVRGDLKDTKTHRSRVVDLNERAHAVLLRQKARTFLAGGYIFINDGDGGRTARGTFAGGTGKAFGSQVLLRRWTWVLKALGLRHRDAYQTRHSYASWLINAYVPDKLVAEQLGHSVIVLHKIYAKQLAAAKDDRKREKINEALFGPKVVPAINEKPLSL